MENNQEDATKQILDFLKKDHKKAVKIWAWGKALNEWRWAVGAGIALIAFIIFVMMATISYKPPSREEEIAYGGLVKEFAQGFEEANDFMEEIYGSLKGRIAYEQELFLIKSSLENSFEIIEKKYKEIEELAKSCLRALNNNKESFLHHKNPFYQGSKLVQVTKKIDEDSFRFKEWNNPEDKRELEAWEELCQRCQAKYEEIEQLYLKALKEQRESLENVKQGSSIQDLQTPQPEQKD